MGIPDSTFRKSTYSDTSGDCVEAGNRGGAVAVRDTKDPGHGLVLTFSAAAWEGFTASLR
jgi:hypothetical protein